MAIWQFEIYVLPTDEYESYSKSGLVISNDNFDKLNWWKYREFEDKIIEKHFAKVLPKMDSWSKDIIQYGDINSNCVEIFFENNLIKEVNIRVDLRLLNEDFLLSILSFSKSNNLTLIDHDFNSITNDINSLKYSLENYWVSVLKKINS